MYAIASSITIRRTATTIPPRTLSTKLRAQSFGLGVVITVVRVVEEIWLFVTVDAIWVVLEFGVVP